MCCWQQSRSVDDCLYTGGIVTPVFGSKVFPPIIRFKDGTRFGGMLQRQILVSKRRMALTDIELAEGRVGYFSITPQGFTT